MTSKEFELIKEMLPMQAKLDKSIMSAYGLTEINKKIKKLLRCSCKREMEKNY